jgi:hypothetical protein
MCRTKIRLSSDSAFASVFFFFEKKSQSEFFFKKSLGVVGDEKMRITPARVTAPGVSFTRRFSSKRSCSSWAIQCLLALLVLALLALVAIEILHVPTVKRPEFKKMAHEQHPGIHSGAPNL